MVNPSRACACNTQVRAYTQCLPTRVWTWAGIRSHTVRRWLEELPNLGNARHHPAVRRDATAICFNPTVMWRQCTQSRLSSRPERELPLKCGKSFWNDWGQHLRLASKVGLLRLRESLIEGDSAIEKWSSTCNTQETPRKAALIAWTLSHAVAATSIAWWGRVGSVRRPASREALCRIEHHFSGGIVTVSSSSVAYHRTPGAMMLEHTRYDCFLRAGCWLARGRSAHDQ